MTELSAEIRLRPTRIGFLVRPSDTISIRKILRLNTCLWGGLYNPIIPVSRAVPKDWQFDRHTDLTGYEIAKGYIRFFEPDVYVEAEEGMLEKAGLEAFQERSRLHGQVVTLQNFMSKEYRGLNQPAFGQCVFDIIKCNFDTERRFLLRDEHPAIVASGVGDIFAELCIGVYPKGQEAQYLSETFNKVYKPELVQSDAKTWLKIYADRLITPLRITERHIEKQRSWHHDPIIYVFNPKKPTDIIDLWNLRIEPSYVYPVPVEWIVELADTLKELISRHHRPLKGNPNGIMHHLTIEIGRSISEERAKEVISPIVSDLPQDSWALKLWRNPVWKASFNNLYEPSYERMKITASERRQRLMVKKEDRITTEFEVLSPAFADRYSGSSFRWANVVMPSTYGDYEIATVLPYNTFDRRWPHPYFGNEEVSITQEGWVFAQKYKDWEQSIDLLRNDEAFIQWFEKQGIKAELSEPGRIAKQVLNSLGGFQRLHLIRDPEVIKLLDHMALSTRRRSNQSDTVENDFEGRTAEISKWESTLKQRNEEIILPKLNLSDYTKYNILRLGLQITCKHCNYKNWYGLDVVDYEVRCERCLKNYNFPQADLKKRNGNWRYRVIGPFAVPNYAEGSYSALLTIKICRSLVTPGESVNFSTALNLVSGNKECEIDFALWLSSDSKNGIYGNPQLVIGEAKSFAESAVKEKDITQLKIAAELLPNAAFIISVLKENFSDKEKVLLKDFIEWAKGPINYKPKHLVILLTGTELFSASLSIDSIWKEKGEPYSKFAEYHHTCSLSALADATQAIYLGMPSYSN